MTLPHTWESRSLKTFCTPNKLLNAQGARLAAAAYRAAKCLQFPTATTDEGLPVACRHSLTLPHLHTVIVRPPGSTPPVFQFRFAHDLLPCRDLLFSRRFAPSLWFLVPGSSPLRYPRLRFVQRACSYLTPPALSTPTSIAHISHPISPGLHLDSSPPLTPASSPTPPSKPSTLDLTLDLCQHRQPSCQHFCFLVPSLYWHLLLQPIFHLSLGWTSCYFGPNSNCLQLFLRRSHWSTSLVTLSYPTRLQPLLDRLELFAIYRPEPQNCGVLSSSNPSSPMRRI